jgi:UDP-N-acetylmuramate: L-alanyl-gamma-D-glutamyl-meso-diaminopimelate ligase
MAFKNPKLQFFNDALKLEKYLLEINFDNTNLLLMSSGNFGGIDLNKLARELTM